MGNRVIGVLIILGAFVLGYQIRSRFNSSSDAESTHVEVPVTLMELPEVKHSPSESQNKNQNKKSEEKQEEREEKEKRTEALNKINEEIAKLSSDRKLQDHLDRLAVQIEQEGAYIRSLEEQKQQTKDSLFGIYHQEDLINQEEKVNREAALAEAKETIRKQESQIEQIQKKVKALEQYGFVFDDLTAERENLASAQKKLQALREEYQSMQVQAGVAASSAERERRWQQDNDRENLRQQFEIEYKNAVTHYQSLEQEYAKTEQEILERREKMAELQDRYQRESQNLD